MFQSYIPEPGASRDSRDGMRQRHSLQKVVSEAYPSHISIIEFSSNCDHPSNISIPPKKMTSPSRPFEKVRHPHPHVAPAPPSSVVLS